MIINSGMMELDVNSAKIHPGCPCLGMKNDPKTRFMYPSQGGTCHAHKKPLYIPLEHQSQKCLTDQFIDCHVYNQPDRHSPAERTRAFLPLIILLLLLVASLVGWGSWLLMEAGVQSIFAYG